MPKILLNRIRTPDGTVLTSRHRHDYVSYKDANGLTYMVDGGTGYCRRNVHDGHPYEELSVSTDDDHDTIRNNFEWGTYGKSGNEPLQWKLLKDLTDNHIRNIVSNCSNVDKYSNIFTDELEYRDKLESV